MSTSTVSQSGTCKNVIIVYHHTDKPYRERLQTYLKPDIKKGTIDVWCDIDIQAGEKWEEKIKEKIETANFAVLLISAELLASDFIQINELRPLLVRAEQQGVTILPVILDPNDFRGSELNVFQAINSISRPLNLTKAGKQDKVWMKVVKRIRNETSANKLAQGVDSFRKNVVTLSKSYIIIALFLVLALILGTAVLVWKNQSTYDTAIGGLDLNAYCQSLHYNGVINTNCYSNINMIKACEWTYSTPNNSITFGGPNDPDSGSCFDTHGTNEGGISNMQRYCTTLTNRGNPEAIADIVAGIPDTNVKDPSKTNDDWACIQTIDQTLACKWEYSQEDVQARKNDQGVWACYSRS